MIKGGPIMYYWWSDGRFTMARVHCQFWSLGWLVCGWSSPAKRWQGRHCHGWP